MKWKFLAMTVLIVACLAVFSCHRPALQERGREDFTRLGCGGCHLTGIGPELNHIATDQNQAMLEKFIHHPQGVYRTRGMQPLNPGYPLMPDMHATPEDAHAIVAYLKTLHRK